MSYQLDAATGIGHVKLKVSDLDASLQFYVNVVGLRVLGREGRHASLTADGNRPLVLLEEVPAATRLPRRSAAGLYHFALLLPDRKALGLALGNLIRSGIHIGGSDHLVSEALYIADPDNNGIEIYADRQRSAWEYDADGQVMMATLPLDRESLLAEAADAEWSGLPDKTVVGHIHLHVSHLPQARAFYTEGLGFDVVARYGDSALFVSAGGYHHHIGLNVWAGEGAPLAPEHAAGLAYFTIEFEREEALQATLTHLRGNGIAAVQGEEAGSWTLRDSSGIEIHLALRKA